MSVTVCIALLFIMPVLFIVVLVGILTHSLRLNVQYDKLQYEVIKDFTKVIDKDYLKQIKRTKMVKVGKTWEPQHYVQPEQYNVHLNYKGERHIFNCKDIYESVEVGDTIPIFVHTGYNEKGKVKHVFLTIGDKE